MNDDAEVADSVALPGDIDSASSVPGSAQVTDRHLWGPPSSSTALPASGTGSPGASTNAAWSPFPAPARTSSDLTLPSTSDTVPDDWRPHPMDPLRFVKAEIRQLLLRRGALSIAQLPEEYAKCYRKPLTQALKMLDSQYTPESARGGKPVGRMRKATLGSFLREHLTDVIEVRQRPHGQHEIVASGASGSVPAASLAMGGAGASSAPLRGVSNAASSTISSGGFAARHLADAANITPEERIRGLILQQQAQQQMQQQQHLNQLRDALSSFRLYPSTGKANAAQNSKGSSPMLSPTESDGSLPAAPARSSMDRSRANWNAQRRHSTDQPLQLPADLDGPLLGSDPVREALLSAPSNYFSGGDSSHSSRVASVPVEASFLAATHPNAGVGAITAAAVGALRGAALLGANASDIPAENRIYVTWRVPGKATPLRMENLWNYFSEFGRLAFCNPRPLRHSHAPRRTPSLSGAGYAFLGYSNPGGAEAVRQVLALPSHLLRGAELRVKPWRDRDEATGAGDAPAVFFASPEDAALFDGAAPSISAPSGAHLRAEAVEFIRSASAMSPDLTLTPDAKSGKAVADDDDLATAFDEKALFPEGFFNIASEGDLSALETAGAVPRGASVETEGASRLFGFASGTIGARVGVSQTDGPLDLSSLDPGKKVAEVDGDDGDFTGSRLWSYTAAT